MSESRRRLVCLVPVELGVTSYRMRHWCEWGKFHRVDDGPAVEYANGTREWYERGQLHRGGGLPALEDADGSREWWERGRLVRREEVES